MTWPGDQPEALVAVIATDRAAYVRFAPEADILLFSLTIVCWHISQPSRCRGKKISQTLSLVLLLVFQKSP
jgi:hypothetical protein